MACEYDLGPLPIINGRAFWWEKYPREANRYHAYAKRTVSAEGVVRWAIFEDDSSVCLNKNGEWEHSRMPSNRDDDYYNRCRFSSVHEAIRYYRRWKDAVLRYAKERIAQAPDQDKVIINQDEVPLELLRF